MPSSEISDIYIQMKSLQYSSATLSTTDSPILMSCVFGNRFHHFTSCQVSYASTYQQTSFSLLYASNNCLQCQSLYLESLTTWYCYYYNYCYCMSFPNAEGNSEEGIFEKNGTDTFTKRKWIMLNVNQKFWVTKKGTNFSLCVPC